MNSAQRRVIGDEGGNARRAMTPWLAQNFQYTDVASLKRLRQLESERVVGGSVRGDGGEGWRNNLCGTRGPLARHSWKVASMERRTIVEIV